MKKELVGVITRDKKGFKVVNGPEASKEAFESGWILLNQKSEGLEIDTWWFRHLKSGITMNMILNLGIIVMIVLILLFLK